MAKWTETRVKTLATLWNRGVLAHNIADVMGTTANNINAMISLFRLRGMNLQVRYSCTRERTNLVRRKCLGVCGSEFNSTHIGNRVCVDCTKRMLRF